MAMGGRILSAVNSTSGDSAIRQVLARTSLWLDSHWKVSHLLRSKILYNFCILGGAWRIRLHVVSILHASLFSRSLVQETNATAEVSR